MIKHGASEATPVPSGGDHTGSLNKPSWLLSEPDDAPLCRYPDEWADDTMLALLPLYRMAGLKHVDRSTKVEICSIKNHQFSA